MRHLRWQERRRLKMVKYWKKRIKAFACVHLDQVLRSVQAVVEDLSDGEHGRIFEGCSSGLDFLEFSSWD